MRGSPGPGTFGLQMLPCGGMSAGAVLGGLDGRDHAVSEMSGGEKPDQT